MGTRYSSKLMVGVYYNDFIEGMSDEEIEDVDEALDDGVLEYASMGYDTEKEAWFVGVVLPNSKLAVNGAEEIELAIRHLNDTWGERKWVLKAALDVI